MRTIALNPAKSHRRRSHLPVTSDRLAIGNGKPCHGRLTCCRLIDLPKISDPRGNLTFLEGSRQVPFPIQRVFYLYDVPGGASRGGHALKSCEQFLIAMAGSFDVVLSDGQEQQRFHLNRSYYGLYIAPMVWREIDNFSSGSVCLTLASKDYDPDDYWRDYPAYLRALTRATS